MREVSGVMVMPYLDKSLGYRGICICQNTANVALTFMYSTVCKFYLKRKKCKKIEI